jgi:hypothetical protein
VEVHEPEDSEDETAEAVEEEAHKGEDEAADGRRGFLPLPSPLTMTVTYRLATSKVNFSFSASNFRVAFNPECFLPQFLPDPPVARAFRTLQVETGVIIFGKATCQLSCTHAISQRRR